MSRFIIPISLILTYIITSCGNNVRYERLIEVDTLTEKGLTDSASKAIRIFEETYRMKEDREQAYYNLLKYQLVFRNQYNNGDKFMDDSIIDYSISYYSKHTDARKLALSYYLKGRVKEKTNKYKEAIKCLKKAELSAEKIDDAFLKMRICNNIAIINGSNEDYDNALKYELKAIEYSKKANDNGTLVSCLLALSAIHGNLGNQDSCLFYATKSFDYLKEATVHQKASIYLNVAAAIETADSTKAKEYALKSIEMVPTNNAYQILAKIARDRNDYKQSEIYLNEALKYSKSVDWEAFIVYELAQTMEKMGRYEEANALSKRAIKLRDSVEAIKARDSIREIQVAYEVEGTSKDVIEEKENKTVAIATALTLVIVITVAAFALKRRKMRQTMRKQQEEHHHEMRKIEEENKQKSKEIEAANWTIERQQAKLRTKTAKTQIQEKDRYHEGFAIYNKVKSGDEKINWDKTTIRNFITFYQSIAPDFKKAADSKYIKLTEYQYVLLALKDMGMSNKQIATTLGITENAVRTQTSRIKKVTTDDVVE